MKLKLGFSPCPNDTFMFDALVHGRIDTPGLAVEPVLEDVETLNRWALEGKLDITKLSYHTYLKVTDRYSLLNSGSALGFGCGPLVIARDQLTEEEIANGPIAIPGEHTTAHMLFRLRYPQAGNKEFMVFHEIEQSVLDGTCVAGVIIHENRFTYEDKGLVKVIDLGEFWEKQTDTPIPLGAIVARKDLGDNIIQSVDAAIAESVRHAFKHPEDSKSYVKTYAQEMDPDVMQKHIETYVNDFSIDLGEQGRAAIAQLKERALAAGII